MAKLEKILELLEEFAGSRHLGSYGKSSARFDTVDVDVEFFTNPNAKEIKIAYDASGTTKSIRFFVDFKRKEIVIWEGGVLHFTAIRSLKKDVKILFRGVSKLDRGKMKIVDIDWKNYDGLEKFADEIIKNKKWLSKYFTNVDDLLKESE